MKIAVPTSDGRLSPHFGRCDEFIIMEVDPKSRQVTSSERAVPPPHGPGVIPQWLATFDVDTIIAGGMGPRAIELFQASGVQVVRGAVVATPEELVKSYLSDRLVLGDDPCDHGDGHNCQHGDEHELEG
jgi:predicted Fe-Mo cluster-binding NifX family protein